MQRQHAHRGSTTLAGSRLEADVAAISLQASRQMVADPFCVAAPGCYSEVITTDGQLIREHPDGSRELIRIDDDGGRYVERSV